MDLNRRLSRLEQYIGESETLDAAGREAYERLSPEELALWEETVTFVRQVRGLPHDPDTVRLAVKGEIVSTVSQGGQFLSHSQLLRLRDACRRKLAEREG